MTAFLIDTNVISEYCRDSPPNPGVMRWLVETPPDLQFFSVFTVAEIEKGILRLESGRKQRDLLRWFTDEFEKRYASQVLPFDRNTASHWAHLITDCLKRGRPLPVIDSFIAATAIANDLSVVTRNTADFEGLGITLVNPWSAT